jgi:thiamine biosynthesis lipoprotein
MILTIPPVLPSPLIHAADAAPRHVASAQHDLWRFCAEYVLGTRLEILVSSHSQAAANLAAWAARTEIERLNRVLNHRRSDSELSELHRARSSCVSGDLFAVLHLSEMWRHISRGAFDGRMGALLRLWATDAEPNQLAIDHAVAALRDSVITLDAITRWVELSPTVALSLDAVAKGYIVDAALDAACRAAPILEGIAIGIGGDIRCRGKSPDPRGWRVGIPDPRIPAENAPLVDAVSVNDAAIATSGRGPRDFIGHRYRSTTLSALTGRPVGDVISASVVASHAADADAIATACMVLRPDESIALVDKLGGVAARITDSQGRVHQSTRWLTLRIAAAASTQTNQKKMAPNKSAAMETTQSTKNSSAGTKPSLSPELRWPADWELGISYTEPADKDLEADFRLPYIALWITDAQNRPVNTVFMLGADATWQRDNFIWWGSYNERAEHMVELRSRGTTLSGRYQIYWPGLDDDWNPVPIGKYTLHLETSQEHGKHSYRTMPIEIGRERFKLSFPNLKDSGGIDITYGHYNDRFKSDE